ncbi:MAG: BamA/TamA family outer membrane protein [Gemmatimonadaceae bacterium]
MTRARRWSVAVALCAALMPAHAARLAAQQYFGQNQVQYDRLDWKVVETEHFRVHYYPQVAATARIAASMAERSYGRLSRLLQHEFSEKKPIIVFASRTDFAQNNIFGDLGEGTGGVTDWLRQRNTLYFIGDYGEFEHVLAHEMVHVFQYDIFSHGRAGANLQAIARVQPPAWFMEGMAEYLSIGPAHPHTDAVMRDAALHGNVPSVERMTERPDLYFPYRFGEALWAYIGRRWGDAAIGDIMNAVPGAGLDRAFERELGLSLEELGEEWREAVQVEQLPKVADHGRARRFAEPLLTRRRTGGAVPIYVAPSLSPDGERVAYLSTGNRLRAEVFVDLYLADTRTGKRLRRLTKSTTNPDYEELRSGYSQSAFSPDGRHLAFTTQRGGRDVLVLLDVERRREVRAYDDFPFEQMIGPTFSPDGQRIAFVGTSGEQSDLYVMGVDGTGLRRLTRDLYGDAQPAWSPDGRYIAFASERGPQTDLALMRFGKWRISLLDLATGGVEVLPGQEGRNLNPQWAPDSRALAYVSDRSGTANIHLYELADRRHYQLTDVYTAVSSFTEISPAISWARQADRLAFVYYEDGDYSVWWINDPRRLKRQPLPETGERIAMASPPDSAPAAKPATSVLLDSLPERRSVYRSPSGLRASASLPYGETVSNGPTVAALLDSASLALPDTTTFLYSDYRADFTPEYVSQPTIGYAQSNYGRGVFGSSQVILSDLLANERLVFAGAVNGRISEAQLFAAYANYGHRLQYVTGVSQAPYFWLGGGGYERQPDGSIDARQLVFRYIMREAFATAMLPRDRFRRWEFGARFSVLQKDTLLIAESYDPFGHLQSYDYDVKGGGSAAMLSPYVAYVHDNSLMGYTAPVLGQRYRLQLSPTVGSWQWMEYLVDYRRYDPILFGVLTIATRVQGIARVGRNDGEFLEALQPEFVRGYDRQLYYRENCLDQAEASCVSYDDLIGSRVAFANAELRFPIARRLELGFIPVALPPVDGHVFYDAGVAWNAGQEVALSADPEGGADSRPLLTSWGAGVRLNLFGFAILRLDYAIPMTRGNRRGYWTWMLGGYGF